MKYHNKTRPQKKSHKTTTTITSQWTHVGRILNSKHLHCDPQTLTCTKLGQHNKQQATPLPHFLSFQILSFLLYSIFSFTFSQPNHLSPTPHSLSNQVQIFVMSCAQDNTILCHHQKINPPQPTHLRLRVNVVHSISFSLSPFISTAHGRRVPFINHTYTHPSHQSHNRYNKAPLYFFVCYFHHI